MENISSNKEPSEPVRPKPVVLLLLDGWGVAPLNEEANAISPETTPFFFNLAKEYPVALLTPGPKTWNARYLSLGAGQELDNEEEQVIFTLTKIISDNNLRQIKITETERLAAFTHFFNGHAENRLSGEEWNIVSSEAGNHSHKPSLALKRIIRETIGAIKSEQYDFIAVAIPTLDLVALSGGLEAVQKAVELVDASLEKIVNEVLDKKGVIIVSSAGGNVERIKNLATDLSDRELTNNPVPIIIIGAEYKSRTIGLDDPLNNDLSTLKPVGNLADLAPTILRIMNIQQSAEMPGENLID